MTEEELANRLEHAEIILNRLTTGFWRVTLNDNSPGENIGEMILDYWRKWDGEIQPPDHFLPNRLDQ
jgi:hypothetical protein